MSELCQRIRAGLLDSLIPMLLLVTATSVASAQQGVELLSMDWHGPNLVLRFSDSLDFRTDMAESDSNLTLRFTEPVELGGKMRASRGDLVARFDEDGSTFRLEGDERVGYSMLWGPWSHTLVIYTFDWDSLSFAEEQFHLGLLAAEQGLPNIATEYLTTARGADTGLVARRSEGVLGLLYAQSGEDSLAALYLADPRDADAWGARSAYLRRTGDTAAASEAERRMAAAGEVIPGLADADPDTPSRPTDEVADADRPDEVLTSWQGIALLIVAGLLILVIATLFARRPPKAEAREERPEGSHTPAVLPVTELSDDRSPPPSAPEPELEVSTPPPAPEEAERIIAEETTKGKGTSIHEIFSPAADSDTTRSPLEGLEEDHDTEEEISAPPPPAPPRPAASRQAEALRRRVQGEPAEEGAAEVSKPTPESVPTPDDESESIISRARRMNVSRDYIELRRRLEKMRKG